MPFITAPRIHDGHKWLPEHTVIEISDEGYIIALHGAAAVNKATFYDGVLAPGFINAHCHLELSHMKGVVPEHTGLMAFLQTIPRHRNDFSDDQKKTARRNAHHELISNGTVAVGDIANVNDTLDLRSLDRLHFYTFVEAIGFVAANVPKSFERSVQVYDAFAAQRPATKLLKQAIVPHAPYSVASSMFRLIDEHQKNAVISIHNQESLAEDEYYQYKEGAVRDLLHGLGIDDSFFEPSGKSSLQTYLQWLSHDHPFIFIHNTYTQLDDLLLAQQLLKKAFWCFCPNANLYIENALPDVDMFLKAQATVCIGTDSLASNHQLSILSELSVLRERFPHLSWEQLLTWGTYNGACALQMDSLIGSIEPGKQPGILQLIGLEDAKHPQIHRII
jgi:cytosine/adenosine deaminase-related metal-dependent hydrolase